ncbi:DNA adenine methylase [Methylomonas sp. MS20]|uniref:DNA adenine methylase n=1 Tax=unclassified Methylomonas TaxID=2608980 RepID=UPI0028A3EC4A|nr:Dam family site-specific DNA-(adenine-N6)-methyltransferase [Methylomonas sp. MV1]MDT4331199.1 Dam family site-specific DNA-(adenine-N6)-methyltransferase [Methylomonas sp. MV1]
MSSSYKDNIDYRTINSPPGTLPFLKWAGGKRWIANRIVELAKPFTGRYIEPFLGSGAVFFSLNPEKALLSDINSELINSYNIVKNNPEYVFNLLKEHQKNHSKDYYYKIRSLKPKCNIELAAQFIYLNRTCWNGLYRVNRRGEFNVPIGTKSSVLIKTDNWVNLSNALKSAKIVCADFENSINTAVKGDLIFADPPYTVKHNLNGFIKYNDALFSWNDQIRLHGALKRAKNRGVKTIITNANHASIRELYQEDFVLESVTRSSVLAGSAAHRGRYEELLIR